MYYCQATGKLVPSGQTAQKLVTKIRPKSYYRTNFKTGLPEFVGEGFEIVQEILVSKEYYDQAIANDFRPELIKVATREKGFFNRLSIDE